MSCLPGLSSLYPDSVSPGRSRAALLLGEARWTRGLGPGSMGRARLNLGDAPELSSRKLTSQSGRAGAHGDRLAGGGGGGRGAGGGGRKPLPRSLRAPEG